MNKLRPFLGTVLVAAFAAAPAMAEDFHALSQLSTGFTAIPEDQLASVEGTGPNTCVNRSCGTIRIRDSFNPTAFGAGGNINVGNTGTALVCTIDILLGLICITLP